MLKMDALRLIKALIAATKLTVGETGALLGEFALLHGSLNRILTESGLYSKTEIQRLMMEVDHTLMVHANQMGALSQAAQSRAWVRGAEVSDQVMATTEINFVQGLTGRENQFVSQFMTTNRIVGVTEEMRAQVRQFVLSAVFAEMTPYEAMAYITNVIGIRDLAGFREIGTTGVSAKAERILRTELMSIQNASGWYARTQAKDSFPDLLQVWMAVGDLRTRDSHLAAHGQVVPVGQAFLVGGEPAMFPGDPSLPAKERINCRCGAFPYREQWGTLDSMIGPLSEQVDAEIQRRSEAWVREIWTMDVSRILEALTLANR